MNLRVPYNERHFYRLAEKLSASQTDLCCMELKYELNRSEKRRQLAGWPRVGYHRGYNRGHSQHEDWPLDTYLVTSWHPPRALTDWFHRPQETSRLQMVPSALFPTELWRAKAIKETNYLENRPRRIDHGTLLNGFLFRLLFKPSFCVRSTFKSGT
jgi:hypothetical protein